MPIAVLTVVALLALWGILTYNRFIRWRNRMREAWSGIDVQLKRRYDLVPRLAEVVQEYSEHERELMPEIARRRAQAMGAVGTSEQASAENALSNGLRAVFAVAEAYPDLKASENFLDLQRNLTEVEDQIQLARRYYNGTVRHFNNLALSFPPLLVARLCGFEAAEFFEIAFATERTAPEVELTVERSDDE